MRIAIVGVGKIARDQHIPAIGGDAAFDLVATVDPQGGGEEGVPRFSTLAALLADGPPIDAVSICTPPATRVPLVMAALEAGLHVMIEKPPATMVADVETMRRRAVAMGRTLFAAWHSRAASGVASARAILAGQRIDRVTIDWREDIRRWHPGQDWILGEGGFGVFDPGINALSILTEILPDAVALVSARVAIPEDRHSPIAASLEMRSGAIPISAGFDFLNAGPQAWDIVVSTGEGMLALREGGNVLESGGSVERGTDEEYPCLYRRFADLIARGESDVDPAPLRLVADALARADQVRVDPFEW